MLRINLTTGHLPRFMQGRYSSPQRSVREARSEPPGSLLRHNAIFNLHHRADAQSAPAPALLYHAPPASDPHLAPAASVAAPGALLECNDRKRNRTRASAFGCRGSHSLVSRQLINSHFYSMLHIYPVWPKPLRSVLYCSGREAAHSSILDRTMFLWVPSQLLSLGSQVIYYLLSAEVHA